MSLRHRTILTFLLTLLALLVALQLLLSAIVVDGFEAVEQHSVREHVQRAQAALNGEMGRRAVTLQDWAWWDDSYAYVGGELPEFEEANLSASTYQNLGLSYMALFDLERQAVYQRSFDLEQGDFVAGEGSVAQLFAPDGPFWPQLVAAGGSFEGLMGVGQEPLLVVARPILTNDAEGPARGTMVMARGLDAPLLAALAEQSQLQLRLESLDLAAPPKGSVRGGRCAARCHPYRGAHLAGRRRGAAPGAPHRRAPAPHQ